MRVNLETPPQQCPSIPTVLLLHHTYSTLFLTTRQLCFSRILLPHTQSAMFITTRVLGNPFPAYLAAFCLLAYVIYIFSCRGLFPPLEIFAAFLILDFQGLPMVKSPIFHLWSSVQRQFQLVPHSWSHGQLIFNMVVPFVLLQLI